MVNLLLSLILKKIGMALTLLLQVLTVSMHLASYNFTQELLNMLKLILKQSYGQMIIVRLLVAMQKVSNIQMQMALIYSIFLVKIILTVVLQILVLIKQTNSIFQLITNTIQQHQQHTVMNLVTVKMNSKL